MTNNNPKVKIYRNQKNIGAAQSRNIGISKSNGEYISFIDADDTWNENKLLEQINFMKKIIIYFHLVIIQNFMKIDLLKFMQEKKLIIKIF